MDSSSLRACANSGEDTDEASDRIRRYDASKDLVVFKVDNTSLHFGQLMPMVAGGY